MEAKVGLTVNGLQSLTTIDKKKGLEESVLVLVEKFKLPREVSYGLKVLGSKDARRINFYVTEKTFQSDVQDGHELELVESLDQIIGIIFDNVYDIVQMTESFQFLYKLAPDPAFIDALVKNKRQNDLLELLKLKTLDEYGRSGALMVLLKLLQEGHVKTIKEDLLKVIVAVVKKQESETQYALSVLAQILYIRDVVLEPIKKLILQSITMEDLLPIIARKDNLDQSVNAIILINAILKTVKEENRDSIVKELNCRSHRKKFFELIEAQTVGDTLAKQLFILQTFLLNPYLQNLSKVVEVNSFDLTDLGRNSDEFSVFNFDQLDGRLSKAQSVTSLYRDDSARLSLVSLATTRTSVSGDYPYPNSYISQLTHNCIVHYREFHRKNFSKSQNEENIYEPGICRSSDRIVQMLAQVFGIGHKIHKNGSKRYLPVYFNPETSSFFEEMFVRAMYLLSKARKEMKVKRIEDYEKVIMVVKKQLEIIIDKKPKSFSEVTQAVMEVNYDSVREQWKVSLLNFLKRLRFYEFDNEEKERDAEWFNTIRTNPCIVELSKTFSEKNEVLLRKQRMHVLCKGDVFPKTLEKKHKMFFHLQVSANLKMLYVSDWSALEEQKRNGTAYPVDHIRHLVTGPACPHFKDGSVPMSKVNCVFSIMLTDDVVINCTAGEERIANYWMDGFHMLLGSSTRSKDYWDELANLTEMDCALNLIDLQNVKLPTSPPPVPPLVATRPCPGLPPKLRNSDPNTHSLICLDKASFD